MYAVIQHGLTDLNETVALAGTAKSASLDTIKPTTKTAELQHPPRLPEIVRFQVLSCRFLTAGHTGQFEPLTANLQAFSLCEHAELGHHTPFVC